MTFDLQKFGTFGPNVLGLFGKDVTLPQHDGDGNLIPDDQRAIRAVFKETPMAEPDEYSNSTYQEYVLSIPPDGLGALAAEMVVSIDGDAYYVVNVAPGNLGWWIATLQEHS